MDTGYGAAGQSAEKYGRAELGSGWAENGAKKRFYLGETF